MFDQSCAAPGEDGDVAFILGYAGGINHRLEVNFSLASIGKNSCFWWNATVCVLGQQAGINELMYQSLRYESLNSLSKAEGYIELPHFTITVLVVNMFVACIL